VTRESNRRVSQRVASDVAAALTRAR
jgi:hypothetical protein